jgi:hypothetical protein
MHVQMPGAIYVHNVKKIFYCMYSICHLVGLGTVCVIVESAEETFIICNVHLGTDVRSVQVKLAIYFAAFYLCFGIKDNLYYKKNVQRKFTLCRDTF